MDSETRLNGNRWLRVGGERKAMDGEWRQEVRPTFVEWRNYTVLPYLLDSTQPDVVAPVDFEVPATCQLGFCDDPSDEWQKEIAFIIDPNSIHDGKGYGSFRCQIRCDLEFATEYITLGQTDAWHEYVYIYLTLNSAKFTNNIYSWNAKPAVDGSTGNQYISASMIPQNVTISTLDQWHDISGIARAWPLNRYDASVDRNGWRLKAVRSTYAPLNTIKCAITLKNWGFACE